MRTRARGFVASAIAAGALYAVVIGHAAADGTTQAPAPASSPYVIVIKSFAFTPSSITIPVGATVIWRNDDGPAHTATSTSPGFDSGNLDNGQHFTFTFLKAGTYEYVCSYHPNMTGQIVVQAQASPAPTH